jgi:hypothetical protein
MGYGHAERNLAATRQLEAETRKLIGALDQPGPEAAAWLQAVARREKAGGSPAPTRNGNGASGH